MGKPLKWVLITIGLALLFLAIGLGIIILADVTWWIILWIFIGEFISGIIVGFIILWIKSRRKPPIEEKIDVKTAKARAIYEMKYDEDNPDNFLITNVKLERHGIGKQPTPILHLKGIGTELTQRRDVIMNLKNYKKEATYLTNATDDEIEKAKRLMAEEPSEEVSETTTTEPGPYGLKTTLNIRKVTPTEKIEVEERKRLEEEQAL